MKYRNALLSKHVKVFFHFTEEQATSTFLDILLHWSLLEVVWQT